MSGLVWPAARGPDPDMRHEEIAISNDNFRTMVLASLLCGPIPQGRGPIGQALCDHKFQGRPALTVSGKIALRSRKSLAASCIARSKAGQSSKSVAKILSTIIRVSSGTM